MRERGDILIGLLVAFVALFPLGFLLHVSPRFPGSLGGGLLGIIAVLLMLLTLPYVLVKHVAWVDRYLSPIFSKPTLLAIHIYAGVLAPVFALLHAAHKFASPIGMMLTGLLLLTVLSGFVGRYLLAELAKALRGRKSELASLNAAFLDLPSPPQEQTGEAKSHPRWLRYFFIPAQTPTAADVKDKDSLAAALSDVEYAVRAEEATNALFSRWRYLHIAAGAILYLLLLLHVTAAIYYGLRWL
ncbi:hypothetical protein [Tardiphaga sp.]|uniref:hypothetical protein n=1 Tax=Tardiphaga sp. TaxID=1926292 RepID=UPI00352B9FE8